MAKQKRTSGDGTNPARQITDRKALVFISHDTRDAKLAEAFSNLLRGITAGMLRSFRSSDKSGTQGLEYGAEWYTAIMKQLDEASDVVCLLTPQSVGRPWILYEAGVAKGKLGTPVHGLVLGMPMSQVTGTGPFGQFQNCQGDVDSLSGLLLQLARRVPGCEPMAEVVEAQAKSFLDTANTLIEPAEESKDVTNRGEEMAAKLFEEVKFMFKGLPQQIAREIRHSLPPTSTGGTLREALSHSIRMRSDSLRYPEANWNSISHDLSRFAPSPKLRRQIVRFDEAIAEKRRADAERLSETLLHMIYDYLSRHAGESRAAVDETMIELDRIVRDVLHRIPPTESEPTDKPGNAQT